MGMNKTEHLLTVLIEECSEVQYEACKALRFGLDDSNPLQPERGNNLQRLSQELDHLLSTIHLLAKEGICQMPMVLQDKQDRIAIYMEYARSRGTLQ